MSIKTKIAIAVTLIGAVGIYAAGFILTWISDKNNPGTENNYLLISQWVAIGFLTVMAVILTVFVQMDVRRKR